MDTLAHIECQRITALIESAVEKLGILASLTSGVQGPFLLASFQVCPRMEQLKDRLIVLDGHNDELSTMAGEEITRIIQDQVNSAKTCLLLCSVMI